MSEAELLNILEEVRRRKVFAYKGYRSLYEYATRCLGLSEGVSYALQAVLRKSDEVPELKEQVRRGELSLQSARRVVSVITPANKEHWIKKAKELPQRALEFEVAKENPKAAVPTREKLVGADLSDIRFGLNLHDLRQLKRAQDLLSQQHRRCLDLAEIVAKLTEYYLQNEDPLRKAERAITKSAKSGVGPDAKFFRAKVDHRRKPIPAAIKHFVYMRDKGQCTFVYGDGKPCESRRFLDFHHIIPVSKGGKDTADNIKLLCQAHHRREHLFGDERISSNSDATSAHMR